MGFIDYFLNYQLSMISPLTRITFLLYISSDASIIFAQGGMVAVPSFGDPPKKQTPAQPVQQPSPAPPPAAQPSQPPARATPTVPPPGPTPQVIRPVTPAPAAQPLPPPTAQPLPPPTAQPLPPPTAQPLPPPTAQPLPPPPPAQPLPTLNVKIDPNTCSEDNVLSVIRKAFERPRRSSDHYGKPVPNIADNIRKDGKTVQSGIEVCKQQGLDNFYSDIKTTYKRVRDDLRYWYEESNSGPLRQRFRNLIGEENADRAKAERDKVYPPKPDQIQAIYFIDGTKTSYEQRNLFHQMSRWLPLSNDVKKIYVKIVSGIAINGVGVNEIYSLAAGSMRNDVLDRGVTDIYIFGFSRGAIVSLALANDICGQGNTSIYTIEENAQRERTRRSKDDFVSVCDKIKALVLVDPVNTGMWGWTTSVESKLRDKTISIYKENENEGVLTTVSISNIKFKKAIPKLDHGGMMCGTQPINSSNLTLVFEEARKFVTDRGLWFISESDFRLQNCIDSDGAWPPCLAEDGAISICSSKETKKNWRLNTW